MYFISIGISQLVDQQQKSIETVTSKQNNPLEYPDYPEQNELAAGQITWN